MPFESQAQRRFMYANYPKIAKRWSKHTPKDTVLPEYVNESDDNADLPHLTYDETLEETANTITVRYKVKDEPSLVLKITCKVDKRSIKNATSKEESSITDIEEFIQPDCRFVLRDFADIHSKGIVTTDPKKDIEGKYGITENDLEYCINIDVPEKILSYFLNYQHDEPYNESLQFEKLFAKIIQS